MSHLNNRFYNLLKIMRNSSHMQFIFCIGLMYLCNQIFDLYSLYYVLQDHKFEFLILSFVLGISAGLLNFNPFATALGLYIGHSLYAYQYRYMYEMDAIIILFLPRNYLTVFFIHAITLLILRIFRYLKNRYIPLFVKFKSSFDTRVASIFLKKINWIFKPWKYYVCIYIVLASFIFIVGLSKYNLPPSPDLLTGRMTLQGIDSDKDGVRDDVQRAVTIKYRNYPHLVEGLLKYAKVMQVALIEGATQETETKVKNSINCIPQVEYSGYGIQYEGRHFVIQVLTNTKARKKAYEDYSQVHIWGIKTTGTCDI